MTTVYDGTGVVNPVPAQLGTGVLDLYDWLRLRHRPGRMRRVGELTPPGAPRYEQLTERLRKRIFDGTWPEGRASGPFFGEAYGVSQPIVQRAFEALEREGLVHMESGRRTTLPSRKQWLVTFEARLPLDDAARASALSRVREALRAVVGEQPAVSGEDVQPSATGLALAIIVESASPRGAVTAAYPVAEQALGSLPIAFQSVQEAQR
jgi:DNA-binding transcriptional regulator YhcF (GntR family)